MAGFGNVGQETRKPGCKTDRKLEPSVLLNTAESSGKMKGFRKGPHKETIKSVLAIRSKAILVELGSSGKQG